MKNIFKITQPIFILSVPFLIFLKPENYIEMIGNEIIYLIILFLSLYCIALLLSIIILKIFSQKLKFFSVHEILFVVGVLFFEIFYHEKIRNFIINNSNLDVITSFIFSLIFIFFINILTIIISTIYFHKIKIIF